jgi:hypothetical protein
MTQIDTGLGLLGADLGASLFEALTSVDFVDIYLGVLQDLICTGGSEYGVFIYSSI